MSSFARMYSKLPDGLGRPRARRSATVALAAVLAVALVAGAGWLWFRSSDSELVQRLQLRWNELTRTSASDSGLAAVASLVNVDSEGMGTPINPLIYGVAFADANTLRALGATVDRWGGNTATSYNWVTQSWNASRDWEFRNKAAPNADDFVSGALAGSATPVLTIPTIGFVARDGSNATRSTGVPAGGGAAVSAGSAAIAGYDPAANRFATSVQSYAHKTAPFVDPPAAHPDAVYQDEWVHHLVTRFGAGATGVRYFAMDNEPDIWSSTHTDVHPVRMGYDDMVRNFQEYSAAVKAVDPTALVLGPDLCCWTSLFYSDLDRGSDNFYTQADRNAHGGEAFLPWWLGQIARLDRARGVRTLDLLDVHYYPQGEAIFSDAADPKTQALRIRAVRSLWDANYLDESWIGTDVRLIPRLRQWIAAGYPGTGLAITEYNFGGEKDASGAVAQAEVLGIFGREGVDLATYWTHPAVDSPVGAAFRIYRNFDGKGGSFGDRSLPAMSDAPNVRAFSSRHSDGGEIDTVVVNESLVTSTSVQVAFKSGIYRLSGAFCLEPGSSTIVPVPAGSSRPLAMKPLSVCVLRSVHA